MQRKQTLGGKQKYVFEPKVPQRETPVPEPACNECPKDSSSAEVPADAPVILKVPAKSSHKKAAADSNAMLPDCSAAAPDIARDACDMVFGRENDPKRIVPVEYKALSFYEDTCFIMELPSLANAEFIVFDDQTCAVTNGAETVAMHPLAGASQLVVEIDGERVTEVGTVAQTYIE